MSVFAEDLVDYIRSQSTITDLVGQRIEPGVLRSNTYPAIVYRCISAPRWHVANYRQPRYQFDLWGPDYAALWRVSDRLSRVFEGYHGLMGTTHTYCRVVNTFDAFDDDTGLFRIHMDVKILHKEPTTD